MNFLIFLLLLLLSIIGIVVVVVKGEWIAMKDEELLQYFLVHEVCHIKTRQHYFCDRFNPNTNNNNNMPAECLAHGYGMAGSVIGVCQNLDGLFYKHYSTRGKPEHHSVVGILKQLHRLKIKDMIIVGDSVSGQTFFQLYCDLFRFGAWKVTMNHTEDWGHIQTQLFQPTTTTTTTHPYEFNLFFVRHDGYEMSEARIALTALPDFMKKDRRRVLIINTGLHYEIWQTHAFADTVPPFLQFFLNRTRDYNDISIYRETTCQHFDTPVGFFDMKKVNSLGEQNRMREPLRTRHPQLYNISSLFSRAMGLENMVTTTNLVEIDVPLKYMCQALNATAIDAQNFRNKRVVEYLKQLDPNQTMKIAKFYEASCERHDLHMQFNDCTHYCNSVMFLAPLWTEIIKILSQETP